MPIFHRNGIPFFQHLPVSWTLPVDYFLGSGLWMYKGLKNSQFSDSCGFTKWLYTSLKHHESLLNKISFAEEAIGNI